MRSSVIRRGILDLLGSSVTVGFAMVGCGAGGGAYGRLTGPQAHAVRERAAREVVAPCATALLRA